MTILNAGDIAFVGFNADNPDQFAFLALVDIEEGTEIKFTDNGIRADGNFRDTEGTLTYVVPTGGISAGAVTVLDGGPMLLSASGDQIAAYQETDGAPRFVAQIDFNSSGLSSSSSSNTTALAPGLTGGFTSVDLGEADNGIYIGPMSGDRATLLAAIGDSSNWLIDDANRQDLSTLNDLFNPPQATVINEFVGSTTSTDAEFIEIYGEPGASLAGLSLIVVESDAISTNGNIDKQFDFADDAVIGDNGFYLVTSPQAENVYGVTGNASIANNFIENSSYTLALVETTSITGTTVSGSEVVVDAVGVSDGGVEDSFFFDAPVIGPDGSFLPAGGRRIEDGVDTDTVEDWAFSDFGNGPENTPTAGTFGDDPDPEPTLVKIHEVQGSGAASDLVDQLVTIQAIVVGDFQDNDADASRNLRGFYLQEEDADADADTSTSEGIFVFDPTTLVDVNVGDLVTVTGTVAEFFGETQLSNISSVVVESSNNALPTASVVDLPAVNTITNSDGELIADLEHVEGMLVTFPDTLTVTEMFQYGRFGEIKVSEGGRLEQFTQNNAPDVAGYQAHLEDIAKRTITIDDGESVQNPNPLDFPGTDDGILDAGDVFRMGDTLDDVTGVVRFSRGSGGSGDETYRIQLTEVPELGSINPRPFEPEDVGGSLKVASFNVLNYFTTIDLSGAVTATGNDPRGADSQDEFDRQTTKLVEAITAMNVDIIGLVELENDFLAGSPGNAIESLVAELNLVEGEGTWAWVDPGQQFVDVSDAISVGAIYKTASVEVTQGTTVEILDDSDLAGLGLSDLGTVFDGASTNRASLAVSFTELSSNETFTMAVNHFKSKGSVFDEANVDAGDGAGNNNLMRLKASTALDAWLNTDPTNSGDDDFLVVGDLNAYAKEDPVTYLEDQGYTDLARLFEGDGAYSYVFDGQTGTLDYAMSNNSLTSQVTGATEWHVNADEPNVFDYNLDFGRDPSLFTENADTNVADNAFRNSDHDPVIIGLDLFSEPELELVLGTDGNDLVRGTDADEAIVSLGGTRDISFGGGGEDMFVFGSELSNGVREIDYIRDFEVGVDSILMDSDDFTVAISSRSALITDNNDGDRILVLGQFSSEEDLAISTGVYDIFTA